LKGFEKPRPLGGELYSPTPHFEDLNSQKIPKILQTVSQDDWDSLIQTLNKNILSDLLNKEGGSLLHYVAYHGFERIGESLLKLGINPDTQDQWGRTPLFLAACNNHPSLVTLLLGKGAEVDIQTEPGYTPLLAAMNNNNVEVARILLGHHAELWSPYPENFTLLHLAAHYDYRGLAELLLNHQIEVNAKSFEDTTALHLAIGTEICLLSKFFFIMEPILTQNSNH